MPIILDTTSIGPVDRGVFVSTDAGVPQPDVLTTPLGFTYEGIPISGTALVSATATSSDTVLACAQSCKNQATCKGFNFSSMDSTCSLIGNDAAVIDNNKVVSGQGVGFLKNSLETTLGTPPAAIDLSNQGSFCKYMNSCNSIIERLINSGTVTEFSTSDFYDCQNCPPRYFSRTDNYSVTNEYLYKTGTGSAAAALSLMQYQADGTNASHITITTGQFYSISNITPINNNNAPEITDTWQVISGASTQNFGYTKSTQAVDRFFKECLFVPVSGKTDEFYILTNQKVRVKYDPYFDMSSWNCLGTRMWWETRKNGIKFKADKVPGITNGFILRCVDDGENNGKYLKITQGYSVYEKLLGPIHSPRYNVYEKSDELINPPSIYTTAYMECVFIINTSTYTSFINQAQSINSDQPAKFVVDMAGQKYLFGDTTLSVNTLGSEPELLDFIRDLHPTWAKFIDRYTFTTTTYFTSYAGFTSTVSTESSEDISRTYTDIRIPDFWTWVQRGTTADPYSALGQYRTKAIAPHPRAQTWTNGQWKWGCNANQCSGRFAEYRCSTGDGFNCDPYAGSQGGYAIVSATGCGGSHKICLPADDSIDMKANFSYDIPGLRVVSTKVKSGYQGKNDYVRNASGDHDTTSLRIVTIYEKDPLYPGVPENPIISTSIFPQFVIDNIHQCRLPAPNTRDYVSSVCTPTTSSIISAGPPCQTGQYARGFSQGDSRTLGNPGTCVQCTEPSGTNYTSRVCTTFQDTGLSPRIKCGCPNPVLYDYYDSNLGNICLAGLSGYACNSPLLTYRTNSDGTKQCYTPTSKGTYITGFLNGSSSSLGSAGTCTPCSAGKYCPGDDTEHTCPFYTYRSTTGAATASDCKSCGTGTYPDDSQNTCHCIGGYQNLVTAANGTQTCSGIGTCTCQTGTIVNDSQYGAICTVNKTGSSCPDNTWTTYTSGRCRKAASCRACTEPTGTYQYVTQPCSLTTDTATSTRSCNAGQYLVGFTKGSSTQPGTMGSCTNCTAPSSTQYVSRTCSLLQDTGFTNALVTSCTPGNYFSVSFSRGDWATLGHDGVCSYCPIGSYCPGGSAGQRLPCRAGMTSSSGSSTKKNCYNCSTNQTSAQGGSCVACGSWFGNTTFSTAGDDRCISTYNSYNHYSDYGCIISNGDQPSGATNTWLIRLYLLNNDFYAQSQNWVYGYVTHRLTIIENTNVPYANWKGKTIYLGTSINSGQCGMRIPGVGSMDAFMINGNSNGPYFEILYGDGTNNLYGRFINMAGQAIVPPTEYYSPTSARVRTSSQGYTYFTVDSIRTARRQTYSTVEAGSGFNGEWTPASAGFSQAFTNGWLLEP